MEPDNLSTGLQSFIFVHCEANDMTAAQVRIDRAELMNHSGAAPTLADAQALLELMRIAEATPRWPQVRPMRILTQWSLI